MEGFQSKGEEEEEEEEEEMTHKLKAPRKCININ